MADSFYLDVNQSLQSESEIWYKNLQTLGTGGNAVTFLAVATNGPHQGVLFAVKVFRKLSMPDRSESFQQEIRFLKECDHPSIMRVFDTGKHQEHPFLVAEYLPNTLYSVIRADATSMVTKISFSLQLLSALSYLEKLETPVIHRDIKPQNIFVKGRSCVLGDFGLMKLVETDLHEEREVYKESLGVGMPYRYRTPDQVAYLKNEVQLTSKSDVYQLGLVLAELFTGRNPQRPAGDFKDPVELDKLGKIPGQHGNSIASILERMLDQDTNKRDHASQLFKYWEGIFGNAVKQANALEGRAFW